MKGCMSTDLGIITELDDSKVKKLSLYTKAGNLQKYVGKKLENGYDRDIKRAEVIKQIIRSAVSSFYLMVNKN